MKVESSTKSKKCHGFLSDLLPKKTIIPVVFIKVIINEEGADAPGSQKNVFNFGNNALLASYVPYQKIKMLLPENPQAQTR